MIAETLKNRELEKKALRVLTGIAKTDIEEGRRELNYISGGFHVEETSNPSLFRRSNVRWEYGQPVAIEVYYHNAFIGAVTLAHEVGHLKTLAELGGAAAYREEKKRYEIEQCASIWALNFLAECGANRAFLVEARQLLQGCLDNYSVPGQSRRLLNIPVERVSISEDKLQAVFNF